MRDLLVAFIIFGSLPFILKRPFLGVVLMAGLGYMNPHRLCYGFVLTLPVVQIVAIATLIGMFVSKEAKRMVWSREIVVLVGFIVCMGLATSSAFYSGPAWDGYVKFIKIQILTFVTLLLLTSPQRVTLLIWAIVLSLGFYGVKGGLFTVLKGGIYRVEGPYGTFIGGNNELALAMVMTIPLMRYLYQQETHRLIKLGLLGMMVLTALAAIGTQSRGALVALTITGAVFWWNGKNKFFTGLMLAVTAAFILNFMPDSWFDRMNTIKSYDQDESALGRISAWWVAYNVANDRLFGGGAGMWRPEIFQIYGPEPDRVHDVHSIYFEVLGEQGWPGLALFLCLMGFTWLKCWSIVRIAKKNPQTYWARDMAAMVQVSLVGYFSAGAFLGLAYFDYVYHLVAVVVVTHVLVKQTSTAGTKDPAPNLDAFSVIRTLFEKSLRPPPTNAAQPLAARTADSAAPDGTLSVRAGAKS